MRYAERIGGRHLGHSRATVADESRRAALDFMAGVADGWTKFDLALWLHGPYALASRHSPRGERFTSGEHRAITELTIEHLIVSTRGQVLAALELAALVGGAPDFIEDALIGQHVRRTSDLHGETTWVPIDVARMRLKDRVASLFVADYLNRPADYQNLHVCHLCEGISFDPEAKELGRCTAHRVSSINLKAGNAQARRDAV